MADLLFLLMLAALIVFDDERELYRERPPCQHAREVVAVALGTLTYRCLDCGVTTRELGPIFPSAYCHAHRDWHGRAS